MSKTPEFLGKYRITGVLGEGAMGIVYKGFDPDIRREVAIKTLRSAAGGSSEDGVSHADRFRNEARAAGRLQHPGIVAVYDYGRDAGVDFIAMEYVRGQTLSSYLQQETTGQMVIVDDDVISIMGQLLEALHHAHEQGVWHRDIKPSNLILTRDGKIKVSDFGIARIESVELTRAAALIGTPLYMAPEQFLGRPIDRRVDLYATGVVFYKLLTGRTPFIGATEAVMYNAVHVPAPAPSSWPGLQHLAPWDPVLAQALAKNPVQRFATALAFRDALNAVAGRVHNQAVSEATLTAKMPVNPAGLAERGTGSQAGGSGSGSGGTNHFDPATLARAEATLARHVGPLAQVMVRRAARECSDLPALLARLSEQVSDPAARSSFIVQVAALRGGAASSSASQGSVAVGTLPPTATNTATNAATNIGGAAALPLSPALLDAAQQLLAQQMGPIAKLLVKKAAAAAPQREAFIARLVDAVDDPTAKRRLLDALNRLPS